MTRWSEELDAWAFWLDRLERALDSGDWEAIEAHLEWEEPPDLEEFPDPPEQARLMALTTRAAALRDRLQDTARRAAADMADQRKVRGAHEAYRSNPGKRRPRP